MLLHPHQKEIAKSLARFKVIRGGRRGGKTTLETEIMAFKAVSGKNRNVFYIAPTQVQARSIIWESLKARLAGIGEASEQRLEMKVPTSEGGHSMIKVAGWENRENFRGQAAHHITFDEVDTMKDFFIGWQEIFRPALIDTHGSADFIGTPKKENPNLRRLEKELSDRSEFFEKFHFTSWDNPSLSRIELEKLKSDMDADTYRQEIMADYVDNTAALFRYSSLVDMFSNSITISPENYMTVDIADDGSDKTVFALWKGLELYSIASYERLNTEGVVAQIRDYASLHRVPYSNIAVDAIGVGAGVASSSLLDGIVGFKSSYQAIRTEKSIVVLPNVHYLDHAPLVTDYRNLRTQCIFVLAGLVNDHKISSSIEDVRVRERIIEELSLYQKLSQTDNKLTVTPKEDVAALLGRSPDISDTLIMRMYFEVRAKASPVQSQAGGYVHDQIMIQFDRNETLIDSNK